MVMAADWRPGSCAAGHDRSDRGHLHCRAAAHAVRGDHGRQGAGRWRVENVTVSEVAVAAVTVPAAPLLKATVLLPAVVLEAEAVDGDLRGALATGWPCCWSRPERPWQPAPPPLLGRPWSPWPSSRRRRSVSFQRHGERGRGGRGDGADRAVVEDDRVIGQRRIEAIAVDDDRRRR